MNSVFIIAEEEFKAISFEEAAEEYGKKYCRDGYFGKDKDGYFSKEKIAIGNGLDFNIVVREKSTGKRKNVKLRIKSEVRYKIFGMVTGNLN